ncbi:MAG: hypothetical protein ACRDBX_02595 [Erysipelotrichaceae bacterium]
MKCKMENQQLFWEACNQDILVETKAITQSGEQAFEVHATSVQTDGFTIHWRLADTLELIQIVKKGKSASLFDYTLQLTATKPFCGIIQQTYGIQNNSQPYFMIPGYLYGTNNEHASKGMQPQLLYRGKLEYPKTPLLYTRADRSTHNAVLTITQNIVLALNVAESTTLHQSNHYNGLGIDTRADDAFDRIAITLGYHHLPNHYRGKLREHSLQPTSNIGFLSLEKGDWLQTKGHYYVERAANRYAYEDVLVAFYNKIHSPPRPRCTIEAGIAQLTHALLKDAYNRNDAYFPSIVKEEGKLTTSGDSAWTGGMQVVYPLARAISYHPEAKAVVVEYITRFIDEAYHPKAHLFYESKTNKQYHISGWWKEDLRLFDANHQPIEEAYSAYVNGQALTYLLKTISHFKQIDPTLDTSGWSHVCREMVDHLIKQQRDDGAYGCYYHGDTGEALSFDSFQGAWVFAAIAQMAQLDGNPAYLKSVEKAFAFYARFIENVEVWGMPLDANQAVDEEGNLAFITGLKTVHELTQNLIYLDMLVHCMHYECSWKFAYNTRFVHEPLQSLQWSSCGGSITSTHNIHIHPMGNLILEEMQYVVEHTQNEYFMNRMQDTLQWGLQTFNTDSFSFGFGKLGWATEQFFHTDAVQDDPNRVEDGGIWSDYLPWGAACILLSLCAASTFMKEKKLGWEKA